MTGLPRWAGAAVAIAALIALGFWLSAALSGGKRAGVEAELNAGRADAGIASGQDAANTVGAAGGRERAIDQQTRDNEHAIRNAPGADAPVDAGVHGVGLDRLCRRAAYRGDPRCLQQPPS
ncbi:MAG: hypothetical protein CL820_12065 [Croceicoccus sp.]|nr:hypothetical protein [Croceicoccus sp.]